jgi:tetratricopeptide (TPR) repeat protein
MAKPSNVKSASELPDPKSINASTAGDYAGRAWVYYSAGNYQEAVIDFCQALNLEPENPDTVYGLALALKSSGKTEQAIASFKKVIKIIESSSDHIRAQMLKRLAIGHINRMKTGDWNLEKEMWQTKR